MALVPLPLERLLRQLGRLPGLGSRSAQRVALSLLQKPEQMQELQRTLAEVFAQLGMCERCGNIAFRSGEEHGHEPLLCEVCTDPHRERSVLCVVEGVADLWAMERGGIYRGGYHVLGGVVCALNGVGPDDIRIPQLVRRVREEGITEVILALGASVDGQTTGHIITERLSPLGVAVSTLAKGMPVGAAVDYLDEGTLSLALQGRQRVA